MCGISCGICSSHSPLTDEKLLERIKDRGPDSFGDVTITATDERNVYFCGSILWMQGQDSVHQPVVTESTVLLYNGDIFDETWDTTISDTEQLHCKLQEIIQENGKNHEECIVNLYKSLKGPFSIVFYDNKTKNLFFTRDRIGRNSLLLHSSEDCILISSVLGRNFSCVEIPSAKICVLNLKSLKLNLYSWDGNTCEEVAFSIWYRDIYKQQNQPDEDFQIENSLCKELVDKDSVIPFIEDIAKKHKCRVDVMKKLLENEIISNTVDHLTTLLDKSVKIRLEKQPSMCKECIKSANNECSHCSVGVLFSGGLDCTLLALLADKYVKRDQPIDLINIAFCKDDSLNYDVPDRLTGRQSYKELQSLCGSRKWVFREINVPLDEVRECQKKSISDLVYPRRTILDESLGTALWFAARAQDDLKASSCRVLLLGSGADELFGGYSRHRNAYRHSKSWERLHQELMLDWNRISFRNLARDNRVICSHGRQPRLPYLDENFTQYVVGLQPWLKCFPTEEMGVGLGEKYILRLMAFKLRLEDVAVFPKRALQFGSRIANKKEKGSDFSKNLANIK